VIIAFISSKIPQEVLKSDLVLSKNLQDFKKTGLMKDSVIRLHKLVTIPKSLIRRKLGVISPETNNQIKEKLLSMFEF
jgi:mRNA interferase MazF